ncbi:MAG: response regulator [Candidatus Eiseniibacteriota bacterium]
MPGGASRRPPRGSPAPRGTQPARARTAARLLLVEHDPGVHAVVRAILEAHGYAVDGAYTATQARARLEHVTPVAALIDLVLPDASGLELCRTLRTRPATRKLPVLVLCGRCRRGDDERACLAGADRFHTLPFDERAVLDWLDHLPLDAA